LRQLLVQHPVIRIQGQRLFAAMHTLGNSLRRQSTPAFSELPFQARALLLMVELESKRHTIEALTHDFQCVAAVPLIQRQLRRALVHRYPIVAGRRLPLERGRLQDISDLFGDVPRQPIIST
jgi:hypothetical protein